MALIPSWFSASTKAIAEKAFERGILKYPGMCFIQDTKSLAWVTKENTIQYINGTDQITDIKFVGTNLMFYSNGKNTSDIAALQGLVGEGYEAIPSEKIKALFTKVTE